MDTDFSIDIADVKHTLDISDVTSLFFPFLGKTLLLDMRTNEREGPMVRVVPQVESGEARLRTLRRLRPRFPQPERLSLIPWYRYIDSLVQLGVWDYILNRCADIGSPELVRQCDRCLDELRRCERESMRHAVTGEGFETVWSRGN